MKRDMDLVRKMLLRVEEADTPLSGYAFLDDEDDLWVIAYHIKIMIQAGLIEGSVGGSVDGKPLCSVSDLTWDGQDFLAAIKSDTIWKKTKEHIGDKVSSATFGVIQGVATRLLEQVVMQGL